VTLEQLLVSGCLSRIFNLIWADSAEWPAGGSESLGLPVAAVELAPAAGPIQDIAACLASD
jgi:hypothetical protein